MGFITVLVENDWAMRPTTVSKRPVRQPIGPIMSRDLEQSVRILVPSSVASYIDLINETGNPFKIGQKNLQAQELLSRLEWIALASTIHDDMRIDPIKKHQETNIKSGIESFSNNILPFVSPCAVTNISQFAIQRAKKSFNYCPPQIIRTVDQMKKKLAKSFLIEPIFPKKVGSQISSMIYSQPGPSLDKKNTYASIARQSLSRFSGSILPELCMRALLILVESLDSNVLLHDETERNSLLALLGFLKEDIERFVNYFKDSESVHTDQIDIHLSMLVECVFLTCERLYYCKAKQTFIVENPKYFSQLKFSLFELSDLQKDVHLEYMLTYTTQLIDSILAPDNFLIHSEVCGIAKKLLIDVMRLKPTERTKLFTIFERIFNELYLSLEWESGRHIINYLIVASVYDIEACYLFLDILKSKEIQMPWLWRYQCLLGFGIIFTTAVNSSIKQLIFNQGILLFDECIGESNVDGWKSSIAGIKILVMIHQYGGLFGDTIMHLSRECLIKHRKIQQNPALCRLLNSFQPIQNLPPNKPMSYLSKYVSIELAQIRQKKNL